MPETLPSPPYPPKARTNAAPRPTQPTQTQQRTPPPLMPSSTSTSPQPSTRPTTTPLPATGLPAKATSTKPTTTKPTTTKPTTTKPTTTKPTTTKPATPAPPPVRVPAKQPQTTLHERSRVRTTSPSTPKRAAPAHVSAQAVRHPPSHSDPVLPRNSRVRIVGNNRTKWDLIGREGIVRTAQTLGGWHEVQLTDGGTVRVQRNALCVLTLPLPDGSPLVRIESGPARTDSDRLAVDHSGLHASPLRPAQNNAPQQPHPHSRITASHPPVPNAPLPLPPVAALRKRPRAKPLAQAKRDVMIGKPLHANIAKLNLTSLRRYRSAYNLNVANDCSKDELVGAVSRHFQRVTVNENEVISNFLRYLARRGGPAASD